MGQKTSGYVASSSSSQSVGTNNLPPLLFNRVHGSHIRISRDGTVARRVRGFCKGITFSARPVKVNEKICIKFVEISDNWSGVIRFGFTQVDPATLRFKLPKYACPDLTSKPRFWAKALPEQYATQNAVLFYYVTSDGRVHFGINGEEKGTFFGRVETDAPLWALIDVYGNTTAIEFVDIRHQLNNSRTISCEYSSDEFDELLYPMQNININRDNEEMQLPALRHQPAHLSFSAFPLHWTRGRNVRLNESKTVASRVDTEFCQGYVFTARPLKLGEKIVVQVLATESVFQGCLSLGLTSCDPATLMRSDLPDDSNFLLDRPEYWVISKEFARNLNVGDEISFCISPSGEVQISKNGNPSSVVIHVDASLKLWAFFDIYGSTRKIRVLKGRRRVTSAPITPTTVPSAAVTGRTCCVTPADIQLQPAANGGAVLQVILPPAHANLINQANNNATTPVAAVTHHASSEVSLNHAPSHHGSYPGIPANLMSNGTHGSNTGTMMSSCSNMYIEPISAETLERLNDQTWVDLNNGAANSVGVDCTICYEKPIDAVLYVCGHMCMCYECALQQWRGKGGGQCPLCRAVIRDVIRTYKS